MTHLAPVCITISGLEAGEGQGEGRRRGRGGGEEERGEEGRGEEGREEEGRGEEGRGGEGRRGEGRAGLEGHDTVEQCRVGQHTLWEILALVSIPITTVLQFLCV